LEENLVGLEVRLKLYVKFPIRLNWR